jgi:hypothetical protein
MKHKNKAFGKMQKITGIINEDCGCSQTENIEEVENTKYTRSSFKQKIKEEFMNVLDEKKKKSKSKSKPKKDKDEDLDIDINDKEDDINLSVLDTPDLGIEPEINPSPVDTGNGLASEEQEIQNSLKTAYDAAVNLGDEKLADQIGNTITFFTRTHIINQDSQKPKSSLPPTPTEPLAPLKELSPRLSQTREPIIKGMKRNKSKLVDKYGKNAEKVMYGRATDMAKKKMKESDMGMLRELIRKTLSTSPK